MASDMTEPERSVDALVEQAIAFMRHDGLCGIIGGYGFCSCGRDDAVAALRARPAQGDDRYFPFGSVDGEHI